MRYAQILLDMPHLCHEKLQNISWIYVTIALEIKADQWPLVIINSTNKHRGGLHDNAPILSDIYQNWSDWQNKYFFLTACYLSYK